MYDTIIKTDGDCALHVPCSLVQLARVVVCVHVLVDVLCVMVVVLIGRHTVGAILVAIFVVIFCNWRCTLYMIETDDAKAEMRLIPIHGFPEVPLDVVEAIGWMDIASGRWRHRNESIIVLESRTPTRGVEILAGTQQMFQKRCVALVDNMAAALSFERRRSRNFLVLTCIRKLAGLCLALDLAVTVRWIPSEINVSDRPCRIHDPSDIRDKTTTNLLTTVVERSTHRDKMMAQRDPRETASMIPNQDGTPRATSLEAGHKHCAGETEKSETVAARCRPVRHQSEPFTNIPSGKATDDKFENACRRRECRRLAREGQRWDVFNRWRCGDKKNTKTFGTVSPGTRQSKSKGWRGSDPRKQVTGPKPSTETRGEQFLRFADEGKLALVADDEVDAAIVQYLNVSYSSGRPVSDGEVSLSLGLGEL